MIEHGNRTATSEPMPWRDLLAFVFAAIGAAFGWALHLNLSYFLVQPVCQMGGKWTMYAGSLISLAIALTAVGTAVRLLRRYPVPFHENLDGMDGWKAFIGLYGVASGSIFTLAIIAQTVPMFLLSPCAG